MRTVIFMSGILIAGSLDTSNEPPPMNALTFVGIVLLAAIVMDIIEFWKKVSK